MFRKVGIRDSRYLAKLVTGDRAPCAFCHRDVDNEVTFGKLYAIGDIQCHYLCALLSCCLVQKGPEEEGLFGFMYKDIKAELERSKKHKCSYCGCGGANLGCSVSSCRKQFHLPCGRERNAVSLFYGSYKSFCQAHAPKQRIPDHIMCKAKLRMKDDKKKIFSKDDASESLEGMVCVICYEAVDAFPTVNTFWPPCCGKDAWFHRHCLQRMALSAGMHYLKCPLCNDKKNFFEAVENQGYYVPDRDAAWELEQNAFAEIYERPLTCAAELCKCPEGRSHDADQGMWDIKLCLLCGSIGAHAACIGASETTRYVCLTCTPAAPHDLQALAETIEKLIVEEQANSTAVRLGPVMPSRMSLRRTKGRLPMLNKPSTSREHRVKTECASPVPSPSTESSRQELNLRTPRRLVTTDPYNTQSSPCFRASPTKSIHTTCSKTSPIILHSEKNSNESYKNADATQSPMKTHNTDPYKNKDSYKNSDAKNSPMKLQYTDSYKNMDTKQSPMKLPQNSDSYKNTDSYKNIESRLLSPMKLLEQSFKDKVVCMGGNAILYDQVDILRRRFNKPRPLCKKKKIIDDILNGLFDDFDSQLKQKELVREWCSPKKCMTGLEGIQTASDNRTKAVGNTVENEGKCIHETPRKSKRVNPNTLSIIVSIPRLKVTQLKDIATLHDEKQVNGDNHNEIEENNGKIVEKHNEIEQSRSTVEGNQINAGNRKTNEVEAINECHREQENNQIDASHNKIEEIKAINNEYSNTALQNHSELIAEPQSNESTKLQSPKQKTIEIKDTSLEISEQNHSLNINVIKINDNVISQANYKKSPSKFNRIDTDNLGEGILGLDLETFKTSYLREVDANYKCCFNHKHDINPLMMNFRTVIDFAIDAHSRKDNIPRKRKLSQSSLVLSFDKTQPKKRKMSEDLISNFTSDDLEIKKDFIITNKVDTDKVTDKPKTDTKDKRNERESRKRRHDKKHKEKHGQRSNKDKLRTENRNLLDRKLESKTEKRREKGIKSNDENTVKDRDIKNINLVKDKTELKEKQDNIDHSKSKETCKDKNVEDNRTKPSGSKDDTKQQEIMADKKTEKKEYSRDKKDKEQRNGKTELNRKERNENKEQVDKKKMQLKSSRKEEKRAKDKTRDSKDERVKYKSRSNDERTRKYKVIDEKTNSRNEKHKIPDKYKIIKHDSEKRVKDRKPKDKQNIEVTIDSSKRKSDKKSKTKLSITNSEKDNISVKIKWKKKLLSLKIKSKKDKTEKVEKDHSKFKQYVLQYFSEVTPRDVLVKPEKEVSPLKRKYVKQEKNPDNLKQTSIQNFFKVKSD